LKIAFIINPISGTQNRLSLPQLIERKIDKSLFEAEYYFTKCAGHATDMAKLLVEQNYERVIAVGGDGTVNEVAKALIGTPVALGILPCGSGNGLARFLKIPLRVEDAIELQNIGQPISIDYGTINNEPFFCTCGVGFGRGVRCAYR
jgi:diacylglycerol kinase family enzyme